MRHEYILEYKADRQLMSSLELLKGHILNRAYNQTSAAFSLIFIRLADRVLYHATNVWERFERDLRIPVEHLQSIPTDAVIGTGDATSKYEIEAYLGAAKALFEANLIGINQPKKQNLLGNSFAEEPGIAQELRALFEASKAIFFGFANTIRNHSYHVNSQLRDAGFQAFVRQINTKYVVTIPNIYVDDQGGPIDLAEVFGSTHRAIKQLLGDVRDVLLRSYFEKYGRPSNRTFIPIESPFGTMLISIGPNGFEFQDFSGPEQSELSQALKNDVTKPGD